MSKISLSGRKKNGVCGKNKSVFKFLIQVFSFFFADENKACPFL
jgi:hypothetical protein